MSTDHTLNPDRLIWLSLLGVMAAALITDQARANLHAEARAVAVLTAAIDVPLTAEAWCPMHLDVLTGDEAVGFDEGRRDPPAPRRPRSVDAPR